MLFIFLEKHYNIKTYGIYSFSDIRKCKIIKLNFSFFIEIKSFHTLFDGIFLD